MLDIEFTKLSSKGQIVIPQDIRDQLELVEGTPFAVIAQKDSILLKKIEKPKIKSWKEATKPFREAASKLKLKESDIDSLIQEAREKRKH